MGSAVSKQPVLLGNSQRESETKGKPCFLHKHCGIRHNHSNLSWIFMSVHYFTEQIHSVQVTRTEFHITPVTILVSSALIMGYTCSCLFYEQTGEVMNATFKMK